MKNFISILTKNKSNYVNNLYNFFSSYYNVEIIIDEKKYSDDYSVSKEFYGLNKFTAAGPMKKIACSWDKSLLNIFENNLNYDYFYFIEDDVYCENLKTFKKLIEILNEFDQDLISAYIKNKNESNDWPMWEFLKIESKIFNENNLCKSINPMCRISKKLIKKIFEFKLEYRHFIFHELLFATLCKENNFSFLDLLENNKTKNYFGNYKVAKFLGIIKNKINHPFKYENNTKYQYL